MSRLLSFRVWLEEEKRFRYCDYVPTMGFVWNLCPKITEPGEPTDAAEVEVGEEPAQQYTGTKDKNGKEIYEGDIVRWNIKNRVDLRPKSTWVVTYDEDIASFIMTYGNCFETFEGCLRDDEVEWELEIIGNIYETSELIYKP